MKNTSDAKQFGPWGQTCVGIHVTINITDITAPQIVTSYFPLAWNGTLRKDRKAHSIPNTT
jgi:hypothetical protein